MLGLPRWMNPDELPEDDTAVSTALIAVAFAFGIPFRALARQRLFQASHIKTLQSTGAGIAATESAYRDSCRPNISTASRST
jgi:hypothetical protein